MEDRMLMRMKMKMKIEDKPTGRKKKARQR
jgi:hypothetical protein